MSRRPKRFVLLGAVLIVGAVLFGIGWFWMVSRPVSASGKGTVRYVRVHPGQSAKAIAEVLQRDRLVRSAFAFRLLSRKRHLSRSLKSGVYRISSSESMSQIMDAMQHGRTAVIRVSIPEGLTVDQVVKRLLSHHIGTPAEFQTLMEHPLPAMPVPNDPVQNPWEGYLLPDTYQFPWGSNAAEAFTIMWQSFQKNAIPIYQKSAANLPYPLTLQQWVTLASIVQAESKKPADAPKIAAVFYNRLNQQMMLQSDATVRFASGGQTGDPKSPLAKSPYNTYLVHGLPPGPIDNPGIAALKATSHPADVPYLFFIGLKDGSTLFATTYQQQLANLHQAEGKNNPAQ